MEADKLKLCFLTRDYALEPPFGGIATYVRLAAQWLANNGHEVRVVCVNRRHSRRVVDDGRVTVHFVGARRIRPRSIIRLLALFPGLHGLTEAYNGWDLVENSLGGWSAIDELSRTTSFDLIECDDYEGLALWGLWPVHRYRVILRGHGILHLDLPFAQYPGARFHHRLEALCADRADFIMTASQYLADAYRTELHLRHNRIVSLALPFDLSNVSRYRTDKDQPGNRITVLYVGRFDYLKGTDLLFAALAQARQQCSALNCVLIGAPEDKFASQLTEFISANSDWVTYKGPLTQDQVFTEMARADMLVLPSRTETLPRVLIEAQAIGLPQIATDVGGIAEIVKHDETGLLVPSDDATSLAHAIIRLCQNHELRYKMAAISRSLAGRYDLEQIMTQQLQFYRMVAQGEVPTGNLT